MSIPLDRLYHFLLKTAKETCDDNILIYYFWPHGSKKAEDLKSLTAPECYHPENREIHWRYSMGSPKVFCYDQEPLVYEMYQKVTPFIPESIDQFLDDPVLEPTANDRRNLIFGIWDHALFLHSELNSDQIPLFQRDRFIPVYYWSHGIIARDWFRYAQHQTQNPHKSPHQTFLIYNRAWAGTREYRLKFMDLLIQNQLVDHCLTSFAPHEPELGIHYTQHEFDKPVFKPINQLENYFGENRACSTSSADFDLFDYENTHWEVVLETLFDDQRWHLTEKALRPIACGQPFLLASSAGALAYLKSYGFKTFESVIDESYDLVKDPVLRMKKIQQVMRHIIDNRIWDCDEIKHIVDFNRRHFFSDSFWNHLTSELKDNLRAGFQQLQSINTSQYFIHRRKSWSKHPELKKVLLGDHDSLPRRDIISILFRARSYYDKGVK